MALTRISLTGPAITGTLPVASGGTAVTSTALITSTYSDTGMKLFSYQTDTSASSIEVGSSIITTTYDVYYIHLHGKMGTDNTNIKVRFLFSNGSEETGNYKTNGSRIGNDGTDFSGTATYGDLNNDSGIGNDSNEGFNIWGFFQSPTSNTVTSHWGGTINYSTNSDSSRAEDFSIKRADGTYLEKLNLKTNEVDTGLSFPVLLDRKTSLTGTYDSATDKTTFTLPYEETNTMDVVLSGSWSSTQKGRNIPIASTTNTTVVVNGDYSANPVLVGRKYTFKYQFPTFFVREQKTTGNATSVNTGRLQLKKMSIIFGDTGFFEVNLTPLSRTTSVYKFTGQILGSSTLTIGQPNLESGTFKLPIQCKNTDTVIFISSDSYLPCNFLSAEWEGVFSVLSQRIIT